MKILYGKKKLEYNYIKRDGVYGISFNSNKEVAVIKVPYGYFLPGGGIEKDEDHSECIKREYLEETGFDIEVDQYLINMTQYASGRNNKVHYELGGYFYNVTFMNKISDKIEEDHELIWIDYKEAISLMNLEYQAAAIEIGMNGELI